MSYRQGRPVGALIAERLPATVELALLSAVFATLAGVGLGVYVAIRREGVLAQLIMSLSLVGVSLPTFLIGIGLIYLFAVELRWLPSFGRGETVRIGWWTTGLLTASGLKSLILPVLTLGFFQLTLIMRLTRAEMLEVMRSDFIRFARARGIPERSIELRHALRNTMVPVVTDRGPPARLCGRLRDRHRNGLPMAWPRRPVRERGPVRRRARHGRLSRVRGSGVRDRQPDDGHRLSRPRPPSQRRRGDKVSAVPTQPITPLAGARPGRLGRAWNSDILWSLRRSPVAIVSLVLVLAFVLASLFAPWLAPQNPFDPAQLDLMDGLTAPMTANEITGRTYWLGTDPQGRDMLSALLYGSRVSLLVGFASVLFSMTIGVAAGLLAGYVGGRVEALLMRIADIQLSFPAILVALLVFGIFRGVVPPAQQEQATLYVLIVAIGLSNWAQYARTVRATTLVEKGKVYVDAARLIGLRPLIIMIKHVLPNVTGPVFVIATINLALAIIEEATLSFLGVGMPPTQPSLGTLIRIGQGYLFSGELWILAFPAFALILLSLAINLLGDWLRDALNPRLR
jgi:peptide/nickel transport system permease protein